MNFPKIAKNGDFSRISPKMAKMPGFTPF